MCDLILEKHLGGTVVRATSGEGHEFLEDWFFGSACAVVDGAVACTDTVLDDLLSAARFRGVAIA